MFNEVLAARVRDGTWARILPGDVVNLDGSGSIFPVADVDAALVERCRLLDIHPSGPLWGGSSSSTSGAIAALEQQVAVRHATLASGLVAAGLEQERRALRLRVAQLSWRHEGRNVHLSFRLGRGAFATAVLHELVIGTVDLDGGDD